MNRASDASAFERSGLAALSDLDTPLWRELFACLEHEQDLFRAHEGRFRSPEYAWPRDPLHNWSRAWEYPYIYYQLRRLRQIGNRGTIPKVVDLGSGVTFFPFALARLGFEVICTDVDSICERDLERAISLVDHRPGRVAFRMTDGRRLPFTDAEVDVVYCVSVLEHVEDFEVLIDETARILKPTGRFLLTVDIDLRGDMELGLDKYKRLIRLLRRHFDYEWPDTTIHPADLLRSSSGPFRYKVQAGLLQRPWFFVKQRVLKPLVGRKPRPLVPFELAVQGFALIRRTGGIPETRRDEDG